MPVAALDNPMDLLILVVFAFLIFGKNLPEAARSLGKGIRELKESAKFSEVQEAIGAVNEVRQAATPNAVARAALPGLAEIQDTATAAKDLAKDPLGVATPEPGPTPANPKLPPPPPAAPPG